MEFTPGRDNRNSIDPIRPRPHTPSSPALNQAPAPHPPERKKHINWAARTIRIELFIVLVGSALLLSAVALFLALSNAPTKGEFRLVDTGKYQAVFLNGGATSFGVLESAYFGRITAINDDYLVLQNVYFMPAATQQGQTQNTQQLSKLGCLQVHAPDDKMIINRNQIAFWENLSNEGKLVKAIKDYQEKNPNGPDCSQQTQGSSTTPQSNPTTPTQSPTTPTTNPSSNSTTGSNP